MHVQRGNTQVVRTGTVLVHPSGVWQERIRMMGTSIILRITIVLGFSLLSMNRVSTTEDFRRLGGSVEEKENAPTPHEGIQRVAGPNVLLEVFHFETVALAKGSAGYSLFIKQIVPSPSFIPLNQ